MTHYFTMHQQVYVIVGRSSSGLLNQELICQLLNQVFMSHEITINYNGNTKIS